MIKTEIRFFRVYFMVKMELHELLEYVNDEKSFIRFISELIRDRKSEVKTQNETPVDPFGCGPHDWENHTIEDFLESAKAWAEASNFGEFQGLKGASTWKKFAVFLYCGKIYE